MGQKIFGYVRISTDQQDLDTQRHLLLEYARQQHWFIDEFIEVAISSRQDVGKRRIEELQAKLQAGDILLVAELSRLGREMLQVLNIINDLSAKGVKITFVRQPELSTTGFMASCYWRFTVTLPRQNESLFPCVSSKAWPPPGQKE